MSLPHSQHVFPTLADLIVLRADARSLELGARRLALSVQSGGYRSVYRGRGLEFDEVRMYQPGDEVRDIDWRVTARRGHPHTKIYREERERPVLICADVGPTMFFGSRHLKSAQVLRTSALLAWAAEHAGDRIGGVVVAPDILKTMPAMPRRTAVLYLLKTLTELQPRTPVAPKQELLDNGLAHLARVAHPGSLIPILSDFRTMTEAGERSLLRLTKHNDVILIQLFDPLESDPPPAGHYRLGIPGRILEIDSQTDADRWRQDFIRRQERLLQLSRRLGVPRILLPTDANPVTVLARGLMRHGKAA